MTSNRWTLTLLALALGAAGAVLRSEAAEYRCSNGDLVRRVEVRATDPSRTGSCEVRYWRNAAAAGAGQSLWRSDRHADYCTARARELVARLQSGGWECAVSEPATHAGEAGIPVAQEAAPRAMMSVPPAPEPQPNSRDVATAMELPSPAAGPIAPPVTPAAPPAPVGERIAPSAALAVPPSPAIAQAAPSAAPAEPPASAVIEQTEPPAPPSPGVAQTAPPAAPALLLPSPAITQGAPPQSGQLPTATAEHPHAALLDQVVEQTLRSVQELYGGQVQADPAAFGDLDRDGLEDAAVLVTYQADRKEQVQYLVAYLFDGETFRSVATKNVGGRFLDAVRADLQGIVDGQILVELEALDGNANCCARQRTAFALENGQLVQVGDPDAAGLAPTGQPERPAPG
jgi:hypothetical protein